MQQLVMTKEVSIPYETAIRILPLELKRKGFDVLSQVHLDKKLNELLGCDFHQYAILTVTNLTLTYKALQRMEDFGLFASCSVIAFEKNGKTVIGILRPLQVLQRTSADNFFLEGAEMLERKLQEVLENISRRKITGSIKFNNQEQPRAVA